MRSAKTPQLRLPQFTDEWQVNGFGYYLHGVSSGKSSTLSETDGQYPIYGSTGRIGKSLSYDYSGDKVLVARVGANAGSLYRVNGNYKVSDNTLILNLNDGLLTDFAYHLLGKTNLNRLVFGSGQPLVTGGQLKKLKITVPEKTEQEKISGFLKLTDGRIGKGEKKLKLLKKYKSGVMQKIFTQQIRFKDESGNNYPDWQTKKLGELEDEKMIKLGRGDVISKTDIANNPGNHPIFSSSVKNEGLFGRYGKYMFDEELITWSVDGGGHFFYRPAQKFSVTNVSGWMRILSNDINCKFLATQLQALHARQIFDYQTKAHPSVIRGIYKVQLPVVEEQQKIADFLASLDDKIKAEETKLKAAKEWKKGLLQKMFV